jgi:alpha-L-fucosidase
MATQSSTVKYKKTSPWATTQQNRLYLDLLSIRPVPAESDDFKYVIENQYRNRPDLLAFDLYGDPKLWWVFVQRNMDVIKDPIYDFEPGTVIFIPKKSNLQNYLGI